MSPAAAFAVEKLQLQALAGNRVQGIDGQLEAFAVFAAPYLGLLAVGEQPQPHAFAASAGEQKSEILAGDSGKLRRERAARGFVALVGVKTRQESRADIVVDR